MTIPSRPAPPPPNTNKTSVKRSSSNLQRNYLEQSTSSAWDVTSTSTSTTRYTPTTNWDDQPFNDGQLKQIINKKQPPPPRPPPPKVKQETIKKSTSPQSINILSNLFSKKAQQSSRTTVPSQQTSTIVNKFQINNNKSTKRGTNNGIPPKLPGPPASSSHHHQQQQLPNHSQVDVMQLIDLSSPPSSPTLTQQSNSDCVSVDSFSSDSNYYYSSSALTNFGANNINNNITVNGINGGSSSSVSQGESGFEDDFNCWSSSSNNSGATPSSLNDPFELIENVIGATDARYDNNIRVVKSKGINLQEKQNIGSSSLFYTKSSVTGAGTNSQTNNNNIDVKNNLDNDDHLSNGKSLIPPTPILTMPTIIRPMSVQQNKFSNGTDSPTYVPFGKQQQYQQHRQQQSESETILINDDITIPMPTCPPPPPPPAEYLNNDDDDYDYNEDDFNYEKTDIDNDNLDNVESYCIALYDFDGLQDGDLSFRENDKIYLLKQINDDWFFGRSKRGCEGVFPVSYVDIKIPIKINNNNDTNITDKNKLNINNFNNVKTQATAKTTVYKPIKVKALYNFMAEIVDDLTLKENDKVTLLHRINDEWLYGEINGRFGQFPSNYIDYIPTNLPTV